MELQKNYTYIIDKKPHSVSSPSKIKVLEVTTTTYLLEDLDNNNVSRYDKILYGDMHRVIETIETAEEAKEKFRSMLKEFSKQSPILEKRKCYSPLCHCTGGCNLNISHGNLNYTKDE